MKLFRYGEPGREKPGMIDSQGQLRDLSGIIDDVSGVTIAAGIIDVLSRGQMLQHFPLIHGDFRYGPCVAGVGKFICIGLNRACHAEETGSQLPPEPLVFMKATSSISGAMDPVKMPRGGTRLDWEVRLAVVVGSEVRYADEAEAAAAIAGYTICHDVSERAFQLERHGQWTKGKGCDTFGPIGPWLVTRDEVSDPCSLRIESVCQRRDKARRLHMLRWSTVLHTWSATFRSLSVFSPGDIITNRNTSRRWAWPKSP